MLTDVPHDAKVSCEEVFGPVLRGGARPPTTRRRSPASTTRAYGLQAGVFTHNLQTAFAAHRELEVGGVIIGDVPSYRADQMPYGGAKQSGVGREGVRYAMEDFTYAAGDGAHRPRPLASPPWDSSATGLWREPPDRRRIPAA